MMTIADYATKHGLTLAEAETRLAALALEQLRGPGQGWAPHRWQADARATPGQRQTGRKSPLGQGRQAS